jgi:hypothetical protein
MDLRCQRDAPTTQIKCTCGNGNSSIILHFMFIFMRKFCAALVLRLPRPDHAPKYNLTPSSCGTALLHSHGDEQQPAQA